MAREAARGGVREFCEAQCFSVGWRAGPASVPCISGGSDGRPFGAARAGGGRGPPPSPAGHQRSTGTAGAVSAPAAEPTSTPVSLTTWSTSTPDGTRGVRRHASEQDYRSWVYEYVPHQAVRWERLCAYRRFVEQWPDLRDWFAAPLPARLGFEGGRVFATGRTAAHRAAGYLV